MEWCIIVSMVDIRKWEKNFIIILGGCILWGPMVKGSLAIVYV